MVYDTQHNIHLLRPKYFHRTMLSTRHEFVMLDFSKGRLIRIISTTTTTMSPSSRGRHRDLFNYGKEDRILRTALLRWLARSTTAHRTKALSTIQIRGWHATLPVVGHASQFTARSGFHIGDKDIHHVNWYNLESKSSKLGLSSSTGMLHVDRHYMAGIWRSKSWMQQ